MTPESVCTAINNLSVATPAMKRQKTVALLAVCTQLAERMHKRLAWLEKADQWLTEHPDEDRDQEWIDRLLEYQEWHSVLGAAMLALREEPDAEELRETIAELPAVQATMEGV